MKKIKSGTVFMITGGAKGIGAAAAELVVAQGGKVAICDVDQSGAEAMSKKLGDAAIPVTLDVRAQEQWHRAAEQVWKAFGRVDVLVNNAGLAFGGEGYLLPFEKHRAMIEVNLIGAIHGIQTVVPRFLEQGSGHVVNVGSFAAFSPSPGLGCYCATKHALRAFTHSCAIELLDSPVGFTLVCPNAVETPMLEDLSKDDSAVVVFTQPPMPARKMAEAIVRAAVDKPHEILLPAYQGFFLRFLGLFPGFMKRTISAGKKRGEKALKKRRQQA